MESRAAKDSGCLIRAKSDGVIEKIDATSITIRKTTIDDESKLLGINETEEHLLTKFERSNQDTCINQHICIEEGTKVKAKYKVQKVEALSSRNPVDGIFKMGVREMRHIRRKTPISGLLESICACLRLLQLNRTIS